MKQYEALFIIDAEKETSLAGITEAIAGILKKYEARIDKEENWGKQKLAYPISKKRDAIYYKLEFSADPQKITGLKGAYKLNQDILRVMITAK